MRRAIPPGVRRAGRERRSENDAADALLARGRGPLPLPEAVPRPADTPRAARGRSPPDQPGAAPGDRAHRSGHRVLPSRRSADEEAAVADEAGAVDVVREWRAEEDGEIGDVVGNANAAGRNRSDRWIAGRSD